MSCEELVWVVETPVTHHTSNWWWWCGGLKTTTTPTSPADRWN